MTAMILYSLAIILFIISLINDKLKTKEITELQKLMNKESY